MAENDSNEEETENLADDHTETAFEKQTTVLSSPKSRKNYESSIGEISAANSHRKFGDGEMNNMDLEGLQDELKRVERNVRKLNKQGSKKAKRLLVQAKDQRNKLQKEIEFRINQIKTRMADE